MGCSSNEKPEEEHTFEDNKNQFDKLEKMLKSYKESIMKYKKYKEDYEDIFEQQVKCEKLLKNYFSIQKNINLSNEPAEIKNYKKTFNRVDKLEENLKIVPGFVNMNKYHKKNKKETENKNDEENEDEQSDDNEYRKHKNKKKNKDKKKRKNKF